MKILRERIEEKKSCVCVGLDPVIENFPQEIRESGASVEEQLVAFAEGVIESTEPYIAAIKPQIAFFEQYGLEGLSALKRIVRKIHEKDLFLVMDAKRGDIGSTATAYAKAFFTPGGDFYSHALTVNGYLGSDGILPFLEAARAERGHVFVLVKTSNPSSSELQNLLVGEVPIYEHMAGLLNSMEAQGDTLGAVVGATHPSELHRLRELMPQRIFLIPGYGAQGGKAEDLRGALDGRALVNSSRGILYAYKKSGLPWRQACEKAAKDMKEDLHAAR